MNIAKKIIATILGLSTIMMMAPGIAQGATAEELQAQINALLETISALQAQLTTLQGGTTGGTVPAACVGITLTRWLKLGMTGSDVKCVQALLNTDASTQIASGAGSLGNETTYYGSKTTAAVKKFQAKYGTGSLGTVGPNTRAKMNEILASGTIGPVGAVCGNGICETGETSATCAADCPIPGAGENKVSLAADNPAAMSIAKGAQNAIFSKINFCAASEANTISQIVISRTGLAADADISNVKLYEGAAQVGSTQAINSTTHKATFASLTWTIPANSCKVLTVKASIAVAATTGDTPKLSIESASDITSTVTLDGVFPISSNYMTIAGISVGGLSIATTTPSGTIIAGSVEQGVAGFIFTASSTEGVKIHSIKITEVGSSVDIDISNIKLFYQSAQLGSTVASLTNGAATFDLSSSPFEILVGTSKTLTIYADIGTGTGIQDRSIQFEITDNTGVTAYGTNSGGSVINWGNTITWTSASDVWPQKAAPMDIVLGSLTVAQDTAYSPSATEYSRGTNANDIIAFKFTAGANEGVRITSIKLMRSSAALSDADISNITLYDPATGERVKDTAGNTIPAASMISGYVTFGSYTTGYDTVGLFDIEKSSSKSILVKADVPQGAATATSRLGLEIDNPTSQIWADGNSSKTDLKAADINGGITTSVPSTAILHDIIEKGTLTVAANSSTPAASTYVAGTTAKTFAMFDLKSTGEDVLVTQLNIYFGTSSNATSVDADAADINNVQLYDGDIWLRTNTTISSGYAEFALNLTVPKNGTKTLTVKADIPTGSDAAILQAWIQKASDITATGVSSNATIAPTASSWTAIRGNVMTKGAPYLTIKAATTPASKTIVQNATAIVATFYLTASNTEDLKVTRIQITADGIATTTATSSVLATTTFAEIDTLSGILPLKTRDYVSNVKLFDGSTQVGNAVAVLTDGTNNDYANFTGLSLNIPKGTTKAIDVQVLVNQGTTTTGANPPVFYFGIATTTAASVDVAASGVQSGAAATYVIETGGGVASQPMYFGSSGSLIVTAHPSPPVSSQLLSSSVNSTVGKWTFTAVNEAIKVSKLVFDIHHSVAATGSSVSGSSPATSIDNVAEPKIQISLNGGATSSVLSITQLNASTTAMKFSKIELTADPHSSLTASSVVQINSKPYIVNAVHDSNDAMSSTTVIGYLGISDVDGMTINTLNVSTSTTLSACVATSTTAVANNGDWAITVWGGATTTALDCSSIAAGALIEVGPHDFAIATSTGPTAVAGLTGILKLVAAAGATAVAGNYVSAISTSTNQASANTIAYNNADSAGEIATYLAAISGVFASYSNNLYDVSGDSGYYSVEITDDASSTADNVADNLKLGLKYGGTETVERLAGVTANIAKAFLYKGDDLVTFGFLGAETPGKVAFTLISGSEMELPIGGTTITLKMDASNYIAVIEGSTFYFSIGSTTSAYDIVAITAKGGSSGTALTDSAITMDAERAANEFWLYSAKPTVTLNASSPSGDQTAGANQEVFRFDVKNDGIQNVTINAIRFTIGTNASSAAFDKTFKLYNKTNDSALNTVIGQAVSWASATATAVTGYVTMYPWSNNQVAPGDTVTYVLKMNTSEMNEVSTKNETLNISIEDADFYFDDALVGNANQKVVNLPVAGNLLKF